MTSHISKLTNPLFPLPPLLCLIPSFFPPPFRSSPTPSSLFLPPPRRLFFIFFPPTFHLHLPLLSFSSPPVRGALFFSSPLPSPALPLLPLPPLQLVSPRL